MWMIASRSRFVSTTFPQAVWQSLTPTAATRTCPRTYPQMRRQVRIRVRRRVGP